MTFDFATFLEEARVQRKLIHLQPKETFFSQGDSADAVFYLRTGRVKLTVISPEGPEGKEAIIALLRAGEFVGEESLLGVGGLHMTTATALVACTALRMELLEVVAFGTAQLLERVYPTKSQEGQATSRMEKAMWITSAEFILKTAVEVRSK